MPTPVEQKIKNNKQCTCAFQTWQNIFISLVIDKSVLLLFMEQVHWREQDRNHHQKCLSWSTRVDLSVSFAVIFSPNHDSWNSNISQLKWKKTPKKPELCFFPPSHSLCFWFSSLANNKIRFLPRDLFFDLDSLLEMWVSSCCVSSVYVGVFKRERESVCVFF